MLRDTTNRLYKVYKRMPEDVQAKWDEVYAKRIEEYRKGNMTGRELVSWKYQQYMAVVWVEQPVAGGLRFDCLHHHVAAP